MWDGVVRKGGWWEENDTYTTCTDEFQPSLLCCDNAVLMVWLGVGTTFPWVGLGKDKVLLTWFCHHKYDSTVSYQKYLILLPLTKPLAVKI